MKNNFATAIATLLLVSLFTGCTEKMKQQVDTLKDENTKLQKGLSESEAKAAGLSERLKTCAFSVSELTASNSALAVETKQLSSELLTGRESSSNEVKKLTIQLTETQSKLQSVQLELASTAGELKGLLREQETAKKEQDRTKMEAASMSSIKVQVGLTMGSGETKPAGNMKLYLTKESFCATVRCNNPNDAGVDKTGWVWWMGKKFAASSPEYAAESERIDRSLARAAVAVGTTDFGGQTTFENIPSGNYYIVGTTLLGGGASLMKNVVVNTGQNHVALGNENIFK